MTDDGEIIGRVRALVEPHHAVIERKMMGGLVFMVDGHMCCGIKRGSLMVRVGPEARDRVLALPHTRRMEFGGRSPAGFVYVAPEGFATEEALAKWVAIGLDFIATLPEKPRKPARSRGVGGASSSGMKRSRRLG